MKTILPLFALILLLAACDNTKIQLRAPQPKETDVKPVKDSLANDTNKVAFEKN